MAPKLNIFFILLAFGMLVTGIGAGCVLWNFPYDGLQWSMHHDTFYLLPEPGSTAARAGLEEKDILLSVDGVSIESNYPQYALKQIGEQVTLTIWRENRSLTYAVTLVEPGLAIRVGRLEPLVVGVVCWLCGLFIWMKRPFQSIRRLYFLLSQVTLGTLLSGALSSLWVPGFPEIFSYFLLFLAPLMLHFYAVFPNPLAQKFRHILTGFAYSTAGGLAIIHLALQAFFLQGSHWMFLQAVQRFFVGGLITFGLLLLLRPQPVTYKQNQQQGRFLLAGMLTSLLPLLTLSFLPGLFFGKPLVNYIWTFPFVTLFPITYALAIQINKLDKVDRVLNQIVVYFILILFLLGGYILIFAALAPLVASLSWCQYLLGAFLSLFIAVLFKPIHLQFQRLVDRLFYGGWYDYRMLVRTASEKLAKVHDQSQLSEQLLTICETMRFQAAAFLWPQDNLLVPYNSFGYSPAQVQPWKIPLGGSFTRSLFSQTLPCHLAQLRKTLTTPGLSPSERALLEAEDILFILPLLSHTNICGLLLLGERQEAVTLDREDQEILRIMMAQAAMAAENVILFESLRARLSEVEQIRDELGEAQGRLTDSLEAERLRLAQELHDGPIQDLYGARYKIGNMVEGLPDEVSVRHLQAIEALLQQVTENLRAVCLTLRPPTLMQFGLSNTIYSYIQYLRHTYSQMQIEPILEEDGQSLSERTRLALFRICQEALNNVIRHANAQYVLVRFVFDQEQAVLEISDDGKGFLVPERWIIPARQGHFGLLGSAERAETIGGQLQVLSVLGEGTTVRVTVPRCPD